jgi:GNAT superfamily N-acetyltransferase
MWTLDDITEEKIHQEAHLFFIASLGDEAAGTFRFQTEDKLFWPELPDGESAFVHRLAIRRRFARQGLATAMLECAVARADSLGKKFLRLDCAADRPRLRKFYEDFGFVYHSDQQVGPYLVARYEYATRGKPAPQ